VERTGKEHSFPENNERARGIESERRLRITERRRDVISSLCVDKTRQARGQHHYNSMIHWLEDLEL
jgi:hypothetical protein